MFPFAPRNEQLLKMQELVNRQADQFDQALGYARSLLGITSPKLATDCLELICQSVVLMTEMSFAVTTYESKLDEIGRNASSDELRDDHLARARKSVQLIVKMCNEDCSALANLLLGVIQADAALSYGASRSLPIARELSDRLEEMVGTVRLNRDARVTQLGIIDIVLGFC